MHEIHAEENVFNGRIDLNIIQCRNRPKRVQLRKFYRITKLYLAT